MERLLIFVLFSLVLDISASELPRYSSRSWQMDKGLPHSSVSAVCQTSDGYIWAGTSHGLARFDGIRFTVFDLQNTPSLKNNSIRSLYQTRDGTLWIGTEKGLSSLRDGKFVASSLPCNGPVRALLETRDGSLWVGTMDGLACGKNEKWSWFTTTNGLSDNVILALCEDREGNIWLGTGTGLTLFKDRFGGTVNRYFDLPGTSIRALLCDRKNILWIGLDGGGLAQLKDGAFNYFTRSDGIPDGSITSVMEDSNGQLWVGTLGGLCRRVGEKFATESNSEGMSYDTVFCLTEDSEHNLWLGTKEGLNQLQTMPFKAQTTQQGLSHNNVMSVYEDSRRTLWMATWGGGLNGLTRGKLVTYNSAKGGLFDLLLSVHETWDGSLWLGTDHGGGLFRLKDGVVTQYGTNMGFMESVARVIYEDRAGNLWIGANGGLYVKQAEGFHRFTTGDGLAGNTIRAICEDRGGDLWIGTNDGLTRRRNGKFSSVTTKDGLSSNQVLSIYEDRERNLWIGTAGGGLNRIANSEQQISNAKDSKHSELEIRNSKFRSYTTKDGLFSDTVFEILEDDHGYLWMSCLSGIFRVKKKELDDFDRGMIQTIRCGSYGKMEGMASVQCNGVAKPAGWKSKDGRLWFATTRGAVVVDPSSIRDNDSPPPVVIEEVIADKKIRSFNSKVQNQKGTKAAATLNLEPETLNFPPGRGEIEFHYTALSFRAPEKNRFKYKLESVDADWIDAGARRVAFYNNLKPGDYRFRVMACNNDGVWNQPGENIKFSLQPHYWQTLWFKGALIGCLGLIVGGGYRVRIGRLKEIERLRLKIAADLHDEVGSTLGSISVLSEMLKDFGEIGDEERKDIVKINQLSMQTAGSIREIVWFINPEYDTLHELLLRMKDVAGTLLIGIDCRFEAPTENLSRRLPLEFRQNLFLIFKETLANVMKHAKATCVQIRLQEQNGIWELSSRDNGRGFNPAVIRSGNGLKNLHRRAAKLNGTLEIKSVPGQGTEMLFSAKAHR